MKKLFPAAALLVLLSACGYKSDLYLPKKGDPDFLNWINHFLAQIKHDGTYDELHERWFVDSKWLDRIQ